ncbi:hypothetical protein MHI18_09540 [Peribacillus sp. FSL H8-0477]|uniref:hypothetical protein n=1 Tax=Peribacillus sp. FSL H8-0477 TaxID=2921388 RepID=UPI0030FC4717
MPKKGKKSPNSGPCPSPNPNPIPGLSTICEVLESNLAAVRENTGWRLVLSYNDPLTGVPISSDVVNVDLVGRTVLVDNAGVTRTFTCNELSGIWESYAIVGTGAGTSNIPPLSCNVVCGLLANNLRQQRANGWITSPFALFGTTNYELLAVNLATCQVTVRTIALPPAIVTLTCAEVAASWSSFQVYNV